MLQRLGGRAIGLPLSRFRTLRHQVASKSTIEIGERGSALVALNDRAYLLALGLGT